jgi:bacterioferritin-associated ferredoxin
MIVCICNNVRSEQIKESIALGASSVHEVREATTATACCGKCQFKVNSLIQKHAVDEDFMAIANQN